MITRAIVLIALPIGNTHSPVKEKSKMGNKIQEQVKLYIKDKVPVEIYKTDEAGEKRRMVICCKCY